MKQCQFICANLSATKVFVAFISSAFVLFFSAASQAVTVVEHSGATNPLIEGWNFSSTGEGLGSVGIVAGDGLSSLDAWFTDDEGSNSSVSYNYSLSPADIAAMSSGWRLATRLRVADIPDPVDFGVSFQIENGERAWGITFGSNVNGDLLSQTFQGLALPTIVGGTNDYHLFEFVDDNPVDPIVDIYIDGLLALSDYGGSASSRTLIAFGDTSTSSGSGGRAHFANVELTAVPLPATVWLLLSAIGAMGRKSGTLPS